MVDARLAPRVVMSASRVVERARAVEGWTVTSTTTPIVRQERARAIERATGAPTTPEMLFDSALELVHEKSGVSLRFEAEDALRAWRAHGLPAIQVAAARAWTAAHVERFGKMDETRRGTWNSTEASESYDWTFTTPYGGTVASTSGRAVPEWRETEKRIDRTMLTARDPILLYDELTLYESELDDNGVAHLGLKVRVMPKCWFVLLRYWLRVDGVLIRLRETRFFCDVTDTDASGAPRVVRETQHREETWESLRARGAPCEPKQFPDADQAASVLLAAGGPVDVVFHELAFPPAA